MFIANHHENLAELLSDFLTKFSKQKDDGLAHHPLILTPMMQALVAEHLDRQPARQGLQADELAVSALEDYWVQVFRPPDLSVAFRSEWRQYLILAVAYFVPFHRSQSASGALRHRAAYPKSLTKLGELLSDELYLAEVLSEERGGQYTAGRVAKVCKALSRAILTKAPCPPQRLPRAVTAPSRPWRRPWKGGQLKHPTRLHAKTGLRLLQRPQRLRQSKRSSKQSSV